MDTGTQLGWEAPRVLLQTPQPCFALVLEWEQAFGYHKTAHGIEMERVHAHRRDLPANMGATQTIAGTTPGS